MLLEEVLEEGKEMLEEDSPAKIQRRRERRCWMSMHWTSPGDGLFLWF